VNEYATEHTFYLINFKSSFYDQSMKNYSSEIKGNQSKLRKKYKQLIEDAYNFRQTDSALSDILEYNALKLLDKLNRL